MPGNIYLLPTWLAEGNLGPLPEHTRNVTVSLRYLLAENLRSARRYLKAIDRSVDIDAINFIEWNKNSDPAEILDILQPVMNGTDLGIISEAGCPGIADPGQLIVRMAHEMGIKVVPLTGPTSIFLALMASGMNGQQFRFHGYIPIDAGPRKKFIQYMEKEAGQRGETQIFMETPYRNNQLLKLLTETLNGDTLLCVAANISAENEFIRTRTVKYWKKHLPDLHKQPAIFLIL